MVAVAKGFRTRAELGLRQPRSVSRNITPSRGGACPHWGGDAPRIRTHADCEATWRGWQRFHMDSRGWADIAYNVGYCQHGIVLAGRGLGIRSGANGTNDGNQRFHAFVWVGGEGMTPSKDALNALDWLIVNAREHGAGWAVVPHRRFTGSKCPGHELIRHSGRRDGQAIASEPAPDQEDDDMLVAGKSSGQAVEQWQHTLNLGLYLTGGGFNGGGEPHDRGGSHLKVDGEFGTRTVEATWHMIRRVELRLGRRSFYADHVEVTPITQGIIAAEIVRMLAADKAA